MKLKKIYILLALTSLLLLVSTIQSTYAKYVSKATASSNFTIASWNFIVNNQDITANNDFSKNIVPVFENNPNIKDNVIAPTASGYFDIIIDHSNVDVSFTEKIILNPTENNQISDLKITGYTLNDGNLNTLETNEITNDCLLDDTNKINKYRIFITWIDGDGETMDNKADTKATESTNTSIDVNLSFIQKAK